MASWTYIFVVTQLLAISIVVFLWLVKRILSSLEDAICFWVVTLGAMRNRSLKANLRMHAYLTQPSYLDEVSLNELFEFLKESLDSNRGTVTDLSKVLLSYSHILLCREKTDGTLRGMFCFSIKHKETHTELRMGLTFFKNHYSGGYLMYLVPAYALLKDLIYRPRTPIYVTGKTFSYKSYLVAAKFKEFFPRYDQETPAFYKEMFSSFAEDIKLPSEHYDPDRCILQRTTSQMKTYVSPITEKDRANPHIKFFEQINPNWSEGHCLFNGFKLSWVEVARVIFSRHRKTDHRPRPKLRKRRTFMEPSANRFDVHSFELDYLGEVCEHNHRVETDHDTTDGGVDDMSVPDDLNFKF